MSPPTKQPTFWFLSRPPSCCAQGYGFITFSNPQAAEQAMLLFNNYPLGGGAIHVAYSTSATAKARQQALRQVWVSVE